MQDQGSPSKKRQPTGISARHSRKCRSHDGGACNCDPSYRAWVYDRRAIRHQPDCTGVGVGCRCPRGAKIRKTFLTLAAAKTWRADAVSALNRGRFAAPSRQTLRDAAEAWIVGATADPPTVLARTGRRYKPSVLRGYKADLDNYILPDLGGHRLSDVRRGDLQRLVDRLLGQGLSASKVRNVIMPLRAIYRHAIERDEGVDVNPTTNLRLPSELGVRERVATADEAALLLAALPESDRALWATAFYGGLRMGELRGLRWDDVDLAAGVIGVERSWDAKDGEIAPKSRKGTRDAPITAILRDFLVEHKARTSRDGRDFVFGAAADRPFTPSHMRKRAKRAWAAENVRRAERELARLAPIGLHECRHTYVTMMHEAGVPLERIGDYVGHSSAWMTERYRHLLPGRGSEDMALFDAYLARADTGARLSQLEARGGEAEA